MNYFFYLHIISCILYPLIARSIMKVSVQNFIWISKILLLQHTLIQSHIDINYVIDEELPVLYCIGNVLKDSKFNKSFLNTKINTSRFTLYAEEKINRYFSLDIKTGDLLLASRLDREVVCETISFANSCIFKLVVILMPSYLFRVSISVKDINDNAPFFRKSTYILNIPESVALLYKVPLETATDLDLAEFSVQSYLLLGAGKTFSLKFEIPSILELIVEEHLDFDNASTREYSTKLVACDGGSPSKCGQQNLLIKVADVNDNPPKFIKTIDSVYVTESSEINTVLYTAKAIDVDFGIYGKVGYNISEKNKSVYRKMFQIDPITGEIVLKLPLKLVDVAVFNIKITATDEFGRGPHSSEMVLKVYIQSENKHSPEILLKQSPHLTVNSFFLNENVNNDTFVGLIMAEDKDKFESGQVECRLISKNAEKFRIQLSNKINHKTFYLITTAGEIDCEKSSLLSMTVECSDFGKEPKSSKLNFSIHIIDYNEYPPEFQSTKVSGSVLENSPPGVFILRVTARDRDHSSNITYSIKFNNIFKINPLSGEIVTFQPIDREILGNNVDLVIIATDNTNNKILTSQVAAFINILDLNDNIPKLVNNTEYSVVENVDYSMKILTQLISYDPDLEDNGIVEYELVSITEFRKGSNTILNDTFFVDSFSGDVFLNGSQ